MMYAGHRIERKHPRVVAIGTQLRVRVSFSEYEIVTVRHCQRRRPVFGPGYVYVFRCSDGRSWLYHWSLEHRDQVEIATDMRWCVITDFRAVGGRYEIGPAMLYRFARKELHSIAREWRTSNGNATALVSGRSCVFGPELPGQRPTAVLVRNRNITRAMLFLAAKSAQ